MKIHKTLLMFFKSFGHFLRLNLSPSYTSKSSRAISIILLLNVLLFHFFFAFLCSSYFIVIVRYPLVAWLPESLHLLYCLRIFQLRLLCQFYFAFLCSCHVIVILWCPLVAWLPESLQLLHCLRISNLSCGDQLFSWSYFSLTCIFSFWKLTLLLNLYPHLLDHGCFFPILIVFLTIKRFFFTTLKFRMYLNQDYNPNHEFLHLLEAQFTSPFLFPNTHKYISIFFSQHLPPSVTSLNAWFLILGIQ